MKYLLTLFCVIISYSFVQAQDKVIPLIQENAFLISLGDANLAYERKLLRTGNLRINGRVGIRPVTFNSFNGLTPVVGLSLVNRPDKVWHLEFSGNWIEGGAFGTLGFRYQRPEPSLLIVRTGASYGRYGFRNDFDLGLYFGIGFSFGSLW